MTNDQLKKLETDLWASANALRAYGGLKASDYAVPVLGLIFLKFADNKYSQFEEQILAEYNKKKGKRTEQAIEEIAIAACGFYLPKKSRFETLLNLPSDKSMAKALRTAMEGIEKYQDAKFKNVLPTEAYFDIEKKKDDILPQLLKSFSDIPQDATGDIFGKIYEYFLGKFAMSEGQKGGEFFTPTSVVRFIVEVIEPFNGKLFDPACGSGGMFVQSATLIRNSQRDLNDIYVCGQEYMGETVRLAKMNLLVNNLRGEILEANSYDSDPYDSYGKFDYVMANPPFNVKSVKESTVKEDKRFYEYGLPKNKGKKDDKITDANYLWISLFATSLNETGRAGFVMPNSASDARNSEYEIRKKIVDSGMVDCMVSMPSNMFLTVTLPATLWFFDKQKIQTDRKDKILFLDARKTFRQIDRAHREWTEEQQQNLAAIVRLYRGEEERFTDLINQYFEKINDLIIGENTDVKMYKLVEDLDDWKESTSTWMNSQLRSAWTDAGANLTEKQKTIAGDFHVEDHFTKLELQFKPLFEHYSELFGWAAGFVEDWSKHYKTAKRAKQIKSHKALKEILEGTQVRITEALRIFKVIEKGLEELMTFFDKKLKITKNKKYKAAKGTYDAAFVQKANRFKERASKIQYFLEQIQWLQERFPEGKYEDVVGLCKVADREEFVEEQDYSLNAGRYVGVEVEDDSITEKEFKDLINHKFKSFSKLSVLSRNYEKEITEGLKTLLA